VEQNTEIKWLVYNYPLFWRYGV